MYYCLVLTGDGCHVAGAEEVPYVDMGYCADCKKSNDDGGQEDEDDEGERFVAECDVHGVFLSCAC